MIIAVDFDDTLYINGSPNIPLFNQLIAERQRGARVILWSCRAGKRLHEAVSFCNQNGLLLDAVNENLPDIIMMLGYNPRKVMADVYIDDKNGHLIL